MHQDEQRPNPDIVLRGLKDFQLNTVEYVFRHLFDGYGSRRFLVADEVGLGKTLVARGVIAKTIDYLWEEQERGKPMRIDIIYVCSNADIARQNINRLKLPGQEQFALPTRITMLPTVLHDLEKNRANFVSLTPNTSFNLRSSLGRQEERALLYWLLDSIWGLKGAGPLNVLEGTASKSNFRRLVKNYRSFKKQGFDESIMTRFSDAIARRCAVNETEGKETIKQRFDDLCYLFRRSRKHIPPGQRWLRRQVVGELRELLAVACITSLEPDLIILDEFQRFKHLLDGTDSAGWLARDLFEYPNAKTLLLSATPYKMYTLTDEAGIDDHYQDFLRTTDFLFNSEQRMARFRNDVQSFRRAFYRLGIDGQQQRVFDSLLQTKENMEKQLKQVMVRTEKLAASPDHGGMLEDRREGRTYDLAPLQVSDLTAYVSLQRVGNLLKQPNTMEYWKSAPYLLNFMDKYKLKQTFSKALIGESQDKELLQVLAGANELLLSRELIESYSQVDPGNARLRYLTNDVIGPGAWQLLWLPPSLPYYSLGNPFSKPDLQSFTKRLVFSSWQVVPKAVTSLLSYEAERHMLMAEVNPENTQEARKKRSRLLQFRRTKDAQGEERLAGLPIFTLLYPCLTLAQECDPLEYFSSTNGSELPLLHELEQKISDKITGWLKKLKPYRKSLGRVDEAWYWAAPIMLDLHFHKKDAKDWWSVDDLAERWKGEADPSEEDEHDVSLWEEHVNYIRKLIAGDITLGRPPDDLALVLAQMAIASPAVASLRALSRITGGLELAADPTLMFGAASTAWSFLTLFNIPEVIALLRSMNQEEPYWRRVLEYCVAGCLQAVLDEYLHVLRESLGLFENDTSEIVSSVTESMRHVIQLRPATLKVDDIVVADDGSVVTNEGRNLPSYRLRTHFALRFGDHRSDDDRTLTRKESVREAFNSPFRPFVLVTTSIGQEGLDFHLYCHAVVHWNLPSNPVDLEQREGRVHRYKGHAIRKNLAYYHANSIKQNPYPDPWHEMFECAKIEGKTELVPFWVYPENGEAIARIERHVPAIPMSRDVSRLEGLRRSLTVYRMVFGQNRQEDMVNYLLDRFSDEEIKTIAPKLQINLEPPSIETV